MRREKLKLDKYALVRNTCSAKRYIDDLLVRAKEIAEDARKEERLKRHECKACFYNCRIGGSACTTQPCACCEKDIYNASTNTDALCPECARQWQLCKHCGGDIEMRERRRSWPNFGGEHG